MVDLVSRTFDDKRLFHMRVVSRGVLGGSKSRRRSATRSGTAFTQIQNSDVTVGHCGCSKSLLPYSRR